MPDEEQLGTSTGAEAQVDETRITLKLNELVSVPDTPSVAVAPHVAWSVSVSVTLIVTTPFTLDAVITIVAFGVYVELDGACDV